MLVRSIKAPSMPPPLPTLLFARADSLSTGSGRVHGLDIVDHAEQIRLLARILEHGDDDHNDFAVPSYQGEKPFDGSWSATSGGRSWGMPPTDEERGREAAQRRKELETRLASCCCCV